VGESLTPTTMSVAEILERLRAQGVTDLEDVVRIAVDAAREAADKEDEPAHGVAWIHPHFVLWHSEGVVLGAGESGDPS
jgi:hypothetical protein